MLFLTKDLDLIKQQLYDGLDLRMEDLTVDDLLDDINTDVMTPAWVCFDHDPAEIAKNAYAGLMHNGLRVFRENASRTVTSKSSSPASAKAPAQAEKRPPSASVGLASTSSSPPPLHPFTSATTSTSVSSWATTPCWSACRAANPSR